MPVTLTFHGGTVRIEGLDRDALSPDLPGSCAFDAREGIHRIPAIDYAALVLALRAAEVPFTDEARAYRDLALERRLSTSHFPNRNVPRPFRLGLSATPERTDGRTADETIGPIVFSKDITELSGEYLAAYETVRLEVPLSPEERESYDRECAPCAEAAQVVPVDRVLPRHDGLAGIGADVLLVVGTFVQALASRPFP